MARHKPDPYDVLEATYQRYLRQASLQVSAMTVSIMPSPLTCPSYCSAIPSILDVLYGSVDGQKLGVELARA